MLPDILTAILRDADFFRQSILDMGPESVAPDLRLAYGLLRNFFLALTGRSEAKWPRADGAWQEATCFLRAGVDLVAGEWQARCRQDRAFVKLQKELAAFLKTNGSSSDLTAKARRIQEVFFPEAGGLLEAAQRRRSESRLRAKRTVRIGKLNYSPINDPARQILFTSNLLVTTPMETGSQALDPWLQNLLAGMEPGPQKYWYDHPIPLGIAPEKNEALYGMRGLDDMLAFEKQAGRADPGARLTCLLSASATHAGLHCVAQDYFRREFRAHGPWNNLDIYLFSENDCRLLLEDVLLPLAQKFSPFAETGALEAVFGVDGPYGRHYSFLKSIAAFWQVFIDPHIRATFKIDLDQVFNQQVLVRETGLSALEHFKTALWGAEAVDSLGNPVHLGMIAGALVNHDDIERSLFTPDVKYPRPRRLSADELIFCSRLPQALSTRAEMMCRYDTEKLDGVQAALQRVHVTGGTNGIMIDALRAYRPFTPGIIGRAEDQAYLLSVLFTKQPYLRYVHKPGLIMRHDRQALAGEAVEAAAVGKLIGDYVRILQFSFYARALPWSLKRIKAMLDPFTGCFITTLPFSVVYLRFAFKALDLLEKGNSKQALAFIQLGGRRLQGWIKKLSGSDNPFQEILVRERRAWNLYYDLLDEAEACLERKDPELGKIKSRAGEIVADCKLNL